MRSTGDVDLTAHIAGRETTLAVCWHVTRRDGVLILGTEHDEDITITTSGDRAGVYLSRAGITGSNVRSTAGLDVDNLEVEGALRSDSLSIDLSAADIEAGLFDVAEVQVFLVNWQAPDDGQIILRTGTLGNITRTAEHTYKTELRGLFQKLSQIPIKTYGVSCNAELGDARCTVDLAALTLSGTVTTVESRRRFDATLSLSSADMAGDFTGGLVTFTSGENLGYKREVKNDAVGDVLGALEFLEPFPLTIVTGDTFSLSPGCDKARDTCRDRFDNIVNFRGFGFFVPGMTEILKVGGQE